MPGSSPAALGGQVHVEVAASDDALQSVDLGETKKAEGAAGTKKDDDRDDDDALDREQEGGNRGGEDDDARQGDDDDGGYSPDKARDQLRSARRGERKAKSRAARIERQMVRLSVEVDGLKSLAAKGMETAANDRKAEAQTRYNDAWARRTKAFEEGKAADWNKAEADLKTAERDFSEATREAATAQQLPSQGQSSVLQDWLDDPENSWYDPDGEDADSKFARELSKKVARDGFNIRSQAHFDELTLRLKKARPDLYKNGAAGDGDDDGQSQDGKRNGAAGDGAFRDGSSRDGASRDRGPQSVVGGRRDQGGQMTDWSKNTKVPKELLRNYAAAGFDITDPKVKERIKTRYNEVARNLNGGTVNVG